MSKSQMVYSKFKRIYRIIFKRDLIITFFATFLGAYLALNITKYQIEFQKKNNFKTHLELVLLEIGANYSKCNEIIDVFEIGWDADSIRFVRPSQIRLTNKALEIEAIMDGVSQYASIQLMSDILTYNLNVETYNREHDIFNDYIYSLQLYIKKMDTDYYLDLRNRLRSLAKKLREDSVTLSNDIRVELSSLK